jgi:hypothetical protein
MRIQLSRKITLSFQQPVFRAAKVELSPGKRVEFTLTAPFTFDKPSTMSGK